LFISFTHLKNTKERAGAPIKNTLEHGRGGDLTHQQRTTTHFGLTACVVCESCRVVRVVCVVYPLRDEVPSGCGEDIYVGSPFQRNREPWDPREVSPTKRTPKPRPRRPSSRGTACSCATQAARSVAPWVRAQRGPPIGRRRIPSRADRSRHTHTRTHARHTHHTYKFHVIQTKRCHQCGELRVASEI
jgi:hypothetical protein